MTMAEVHARNSYCSQVVHRKSLPDARLMKNYRTRRANEDTAAKRQKDMSITDIEISQMLSNLKEGPNFSSSPQNRLYNSASSPYNALVPPQPQITKRPGLKMFETDLDEEPLRGQKVYTSGVSAF